MIRLSMLTAAAKLLGFHITYTARFVPANPAPNQTRGRTHWVTDVLAEAKAAWKNLTSGTTPLKEKVDGTLTFTVEATITVHDHSAPAVTVPSNNLELPLAVPTGVQGEAAGEPAAPHAEEAEDADEAGAGSGGAVGGLGAGAEAPSGPEESLEARPKVTLDQIGLKQ